jgi:hypothetical protein
MRFSVLSALAAASICCCGCITTDDSIGSGMIPASHIYRVVSPDPVQIPVDMKSAGELSAYSSNRITIGAIRNDDEFGLSTRSSCITLVPMFVDSLDFGKNPVFQEFRFSANVDSVSVCDVTQADILQSVYVHELTAPLDKDYRTYCNSTPAYGASLITTGIPVLDGKDTLGFRFTKEFGEKYLAMTNDDVKDMETYTKKFPGIHLSTNIPAGRGGRFNLLELQLGYNSDYGILTGNMAALRFNSTWTVDGKDVKKDSVCYFYYSPTGFYDIDSLLTNSGTGSFPQYCANITGDASTAKAGPATDYIYIEGGGGVKPCISAKTLRDKAIEIISAAGHDPKKAVVNKATLTLHYLAPDADFETMYKVPGTLSPTICLKNDETVSFMGLTNTSDSSQDIGGIHRSTMTYTPDITNHLQSMLSLEDDDEALLKGNYDIWLLIMYNEVIATTTSGNSEMADYYNYLAYQSMMYGGYGYGGYGGYGSYGYGNPYTNYYNYSMMAEYYGSSSTSYSTSLALDRDRYYYCKLYGPAAADPEMRPSFSLTYSIPEE